MTSDNRKTSMIMMTIMACVLEVAVGAHWLLNFDSRTTLVQLPCITEKNNLSLNADLVYWRLSDSLGHLIIGHGNITGFARMSERNNSLLLDQARLPAGKSITGQYVCAFRRVRPDGRVVWSYLKWGVNLYQDNPYLMDRNKYGFFERHSVDLIRASSISLGYLIFVVTIYLAFYYSRRNRESLKREERDLNKNPSTIL